MMKVQYVVTVWVVIDEDTPWEDCFEEEYTGERYDTREEARGEFLQAMVAIMEEVASKYSMEVFDD